MAAPIKSVVEIGRITGLPEDKCINTFMFQWTGAGSPAAGDYAALNTALAGFYNTNNVTRPIAAYFSSEVSRVDGDRVFKHYDLTGHLDGSPHGAPENTLEGGFVARAAGDIDYPAEVAVALTWRATGWQDALVETPDGPDAGTLVDRPRQRLSGRIYVGPLMSAAGVSVGNVVRPADGFRSDLLVAAERLFDAASAANFVLSVWSRANAAMVPVTHVQVDDAFDIQRRRGARPTNAFQVAV